MLPKGGRSGSHAMRAGSHLLRPTRPDREWNRDFRFKGQCSTTEPHRLGPIFVLIDSPRGDTGRAKGANQSRLFGTEGWRTARPGAGAEAQGLGVRPGAGVRRGGCRSRCPAYSSLFSESERQGQKDRHARLSL